MFWCCWLDIEFNFRCDIGCRNQLCVEGSVICLSIMVYLWSDFLRSMFGLYFKNFRRITKKKLLTTERKEKRQNLFDGIRYGFIVTYVVNSVLLLWGWGNYLFKKTIEMALPNCHISMKWLSVEHFWALQLWDFYSTSLSTSYNTSRFFLSA